MESTKTEPTGEVIYLLGFTPDSTSESVEIEGLGYTMSSMTHASIRSWYIAFDAADFQGPHADANLENLEWLTPRVMAHQHAIDHLCRLGPLYPARFATLFSSLDSLRQSVARWQSELASFFERVDKKEEWACKVHLMKADSSESDTPPSSSKDGRGYLLARRQASEAKKRQAGLVQQAVDELEAALIAKGANVVRRPNVQLDANEDGSIQIGNLAILIGRDQVESIEVLISQFEAPEDLLREIGIELSGPFAPYSFCTELPADQQAVD